jgi:hypothetical protein
MQHASGCESTRRFELRLLLSSAQLGSAAVLSPRSLGPVGEVFLEEVEEMETHPYHRHRKIVMTKLLVLIVTD